MIYKNHKDIYKRAASESGFDPDLVTSVGSFIWNDINERVSSLLTREIYILGLGVLRFRKTRAEFLVQKFEENYENTKLTEIQKEQIKERMNKNLEKYKKFIEEWNNIIKQRIEYKNVKRNIQESESNLGGIEEQSIS